uniref:Capsid protein n=1 Tax=Mops bat astrovirus TaxID=3141890 RepID=A0AAU7E2P9_9VIRU
MATAEPSKAVKQKIKSEVKKEVKKEEKKKKWNKPKKNYKKNWVKKEVKREVKKETSGPKVKFSVSVTATLGYVDGSSEHGIVLKLATFLHPGLCKGPDEDNNFGPLQAAVAQYGMWRCERASVSFTPMVGASAVSGTVVRCSVNLTQSPGSNSWGGLGARKHKDFQVGRAGVFHLTRQELAGPREGGWWMSDTNSEGAQSVGPAVEVHAFGKTTSTYKDQDYTGSLFIVELRGKWVFTNYNMAPALGTLERHESEVPTAKVKTDSSGQIQLELPSASAAARFMNDPTAVRTAANAEGGVGEIVYQVVDTSANLAASLAPPPFKWLIQGGWWFLKKIIGRSGENTSTDNFMVYASLADAQNNKPAKSSQLSGSGTPQKAVLQITQINSPNTGPGNSNPAVFGGGGGINFPIRPSGLPQGTFNLAGDLFPVYTVDSGMNYPYLMLAGGLSGLGTIRWYPAIHYEVRNLVVYNQSNSDLDGWYDVNMLPRKRWISIGGGNTTLTAQTWLDVYGHTSTQVGIQNSERIYEHTILWRLPTGTANWRQINNVAVTMFQIKSSTEIGTIKRLEYTKGITPRDQAINGKFFLSQFLVKGQPNLKTISNGDLPPDEFTLENSNDLITVINPHPMSVSVPQKFVVRLNQLVDSMSKLDKLAIKMGIDPDELDTSESEDSDCSIDSDDLMISDDEDFQNVTSTPKTQRYEKLIQAGFSHSEAERLCKMEC